MPDYHVNWEIDLVAEDHVGAARLALEIQRDPSSIATCFDVMGEGSEDLIAIDLDELDQEEAPPMAKQITKKDLPQLVTREGWKGPVPFLYCSVCREESSADAGDHWELPDDYVFRCYCGAPLKLVTKREVIKDWQPPVEG